MNIDEKVVDILKDMSFAINKLANSYPVNLAVQDEVKKMDKKIEELHDLVQTSPDRG